MTRCDQERPSRSRSTLTLVAIAGLVGLSGCASTVPDCACAANPEHPGCGAPPPAPPAPPPATYVLAEATFGAALGKPRNVEIHKTPAYNDRRKQLASAAVRPPDNCRSESAASVEGEQRGTSSELASTDCGVWLSEIEKSLVRSGFRVVSWDALRTIERNERIPPYKAAQKLGADVLFLFNSLELSKVEAGGESAYRIEYFASDARGGKGQPFPMTDAERSVLRQSVWARMKSGVAGHTGVYASTLDATAIMTTNGESIWFYRNTAIETSSDVSGKAFLFAKPAVTNSPWYLAYPEMEQAQSVVAAPETKSAVDTGGSQVDPTRNADAATRLRLMREVTDDFVGGFRSGKEGDNAQAH